MDETHTQMTTRQLESMLAEAHRRGALEALARVEGMLRQLGQEYHDGALVARGSTDPVWLAILRLGTVKHGYEEKEKP